MQEGDGVTDIDELIGHLEQLQASTQESDLQLVHLLRKQLDYVSEFEAQRKGKYNQILSNLKEQKILLKELQATLDERQDRISRDEGFVREQLKVIEKERQYQKVIHGSKSLTLDVGGRIFKTTTDTLLKGGRGRCGASDGLGETYGLLLPHPGFLAYGSSMGDVLVPY